MSKSISRGRAAVARVVGRVARSTVAVEPLEQRRLFATFTVTNLNADGAGSLWQAVLDANAAAGADVITFQAGLSGTITTPRQLLIKDDLDIKGPGADAITVTPLFDEEEGGINSVVVADDSDINNPSAPNRVLEVRIAGLTLAGGSKDSGGGGIVNQGETVMLDHVVVRGCTTLGGAGGGIANYGGILTLDYSTVTGNSAGGSGDDGGGGVYSEGGQLAVRNSTISDNSSSGGTTFGGGVFVKGGAATIYYSTISGNSQAGVGGGVAIDGGTLNIFQSTIADNVAEAGLATADDGGGGLYVASGAVEITASLFAGNQAQQTGGDPFFDSDVAREAGTLTAAVSLVETAPAGGTFTTEPTQSLVGVDALIGELADNGGPTQTHALLGESPAIDAGISTPNSDTSDTPDQRGEPFESFVGAATDIGSFEVQAEVSAPQIASVEPSPVVGSARPRTLTINGSGFDPAATVTLFNVTAGTLQLPASAPVVTPTQVTFDAPLGTAAATWSVRVTNPDRGTTGAYEFEVEAAPPAATVAVGDGQAKAVTFTDADGTVVTISLRGGGTVDAAFDGTGVQASAGRSGTTVTGTNVSLTSLALSDTTSRSTLTIKTSRAGDGRTAIASLTGTTSLAKLAAATTDLAGDGVVLDGDGTIASVQLNDVADGAAIVLPGAGSVTLKLGEVGDATIRSGGEIRSIAADALGGTVSAASVGTVKVAGALSGEVRAAGSIRSVTAATFSSARIFAGESDALTNLPATADDFAASDASIGTVTVKSKTAGAFGAGSLIVAPTLGKVALGTLTTANAGDAFGVAAGSARSVTGTLPTAGRLKLSKLEAPGQTFAEGDFTVRVL